MRKFSYFVLLVLFLLLVGCASHTNKETAKENDALRKNDLTDATSEKLILYTSIYPVQYVVEQIAKDNATVKSIYPPGVDAHTYEPSSKEIKDSANSDAFFYIGAGMEGFADSSRDALQQQKVLSVSIEEKNESLFIKNDDEHDGHQKDHHHNHSDLDPHIWLDPLRMIKIGEIVRDTLIELDPSRREQFIVIAHSLVLSTKG